MEFLLKWPKRSPSPSKTSSTCFEALEQRTDMYLSTLRSYVEAMGGALEIRAVFAEGAVKIDLLNKLYA
jgi:hypothetical protein